jgi:hypothetical protein
VGDDERDQADAEKNKDRQAGPARQVVQEAHRCEGAGDPAPLPYCFVSVENSMCFTGSNTMC